MSDFFFFLGGGGIYMCVREGKRKCWAAMREKDVDNSGKDKRSSYIYLGAASVCIHP